GEGAQPIVMRSNHRVRPRPPRQGRVADGRTTPARWPSRSSYTPIWRSGPTPANHKAVPPPEAWIVVPPGAAGSARPRKSGAFLPPDSLLLRCCTCRGQGRSCLRSAGYVDHGMKWSTCVFPNNFFIGSSMTGGAEVKPQQNREGDLVDRRGST